MKECCVICGKESEILQSEDIHQRLYYVEGVGQLCEECYLKLRNLNL